MAGEKTRSRVDMAAATSDLVTAIKLHDEGLLRAFNSCIPACVVEYDRKTHVAKVLPLVKSSLFSGKWEYDRNGFIETTVRRIQQGGFTIDIPLYVGDTGWLVASDRDTTLLKEKGSFTNSVLEKDRSTALIDSSYPQIPHQPKCHVLQDGFFIPDNWGPFEIERFKDSRNVRLADALYIGQSIATKDDDSIDDRAVQELEEDEDDESRSSGLQTGDEYEKRMTSSLVIEHWGAGHLLSSSEKDMGQTGRVTADGSQIERELIDEKRDVTVHGIMSEDEGLYLKHDTKDNHFAAGFHDGNAMLQTIESKRNIISIHVEGGRVTVQATGSVKVNAREHIAVSTSGEMNVSATDATVVATDDVEVFSRGNTQVLSQGNGTIKGNGKMVFDANNMNLFSGGDMKISGENVSVIGKMSLEKLKDGNIGISGHKIDMKVDNFSSYVFDMGERSLLVQSQKYSKEVNGIMLSLDGNVDVGCPMDIKVVKMSIISAQKELSISGYTRGTVKDYGQYFDKDYPKPRPTDVPVWKP